jgi:hypothetical protein
MYLNSSHVPVLTPFSPTPAQFSDINATAQQQQPQQQQQQFHYSLVNFNAVTATGLLAPTPTLGSGNTINTNGTQSSTQSTSQTNESSQQSTSQSNSTSYSTATHPPVQQILIENLYNNVQLRAKTPNQLYDPRKTRKRLSDPVYLSQQQQPLQPLSINQQQNNIHPIFQQQQQLIQSNLSLSRDASNHTLNRRRSLRFIKPPIILQTIPQQSIQREPQRLLVVRHAERVDSTFGAGWLDQVFDKATGTYRRINLNLPKKNGDTKRFKRFFI